MSKKIILAILLLAIATPVFSEEINLTPKSSFSGFNNNGVRSKYPKLSSPVSAADIVEERGVSDIMGPKSVKEMRYTPQSNSDRRAPMTYNQFPQNYDSSNSMMMMQGGMQNMNMFMGY